MVEPGYSRTTTEYIWQSLSKLRAPGKFSEVQLEGATRVIAPSCVNPPSLHQQESSRNRPSLAKAFPSPLIRRYRMALLSLVSPSIGQAFLPNSNTQNNRR